MSEELENIEELENTEELEEESQEDEEPIEPDDPEVIPLVYNYDASSFAFLYACNAERDRAESIVQGHYVPLVPAYATLVEIPTYEENEIPVFNTEIQEWSIVPDYRQNYKKADSLLNISSITKIGELEEGYYLVDLETAEDIEQHKSYYKIVNDEVVKKSGEEIASEELEQARALKVVENDRVRDRAINGGVLYENVLFDSDTDQKVNLREMYEGMDDEETTIWFGMDNQPLECTKADLMNIGMLIKQLHVFCWTHNAELKATIEAAETIEEIEAIEISYELNAEAEA